MAARVKRVVAKERIVQAKQLTMADKKKFMKALNQMESKVEEMETHIRDLYIITKSFSFWIIG
jgi:hypothetical protein